MGSSRIPDQPSQPSKDPKPNLGTRLDWTDEELMEELRGGIDPAKTYRFRLEDRVTWIECKGSTLIRIASGIVELFNAMQLNGLGAAQFKGDLNGIRRWLETLEYPQPEGVEAYWDEQSPVIKLEEK